MESSPESTGRRNAPARHAGGWLLAALVLVAYAPSFGAGFLNYDDPWLIVSNPLMQQGSWRTPGVALFDFSRSTRLTLGAEYLPLRDLLLWLETRLFGISAPPLHIVSVCLYIGAVLLLRGALLRCLGRSFATELAAVLFALHPVHVESVAWLSGQKDVLALLFVSATLFLHAGSSRQRLWSVPLSALAACLSKSMSIAVLPLMLAQDLMQRRRPEWKIYAAVVVGLTASLAAHLYVGSLVGMVAEPLGGSRTVAIISMAPVWLRYLGLCLFPWQLSIAHDVPVQRTLNADGALAIALLLAILVLTVFALRRGERRPAFLALWFFAPLLPVSQVIVPLQNRMADRYLWLSVLAPCCAFAWLLSALTARSAPPWNRRAARAVGGIVAVALGASTCARTVTFGDSVLLFAEGVQQTRFDTKAPYQLGKALEAAGREREAMLSFGEVLRRAPSGPIDDARMASNNLARLLAQRGAWAEAEQVLRGALTRFPNDPKVRSNLAKVLRATNRPAEAAALEPRRRHDTAGGAHPP